MKFSRGRGQRRGRKARSQALLKEILIWIRWADRLINQSQWS